MPLKHDGSGSNPEAGASLPDERAGLMTLLSAQEWRYTSSSPCRERGIQSCPWHPEDWQSGNASDC